MAGAQCCENAPTLNPSYGAGIVEDFGGLKTYISGPRDSKFAILLVADVFGFDAPNLRKLADKVGAAGFLVVVPDFLYGEPLVQNNPNKTVQAWLADHPTDKAAEDAKPVLEALRNKGVSKIGAAGFCWGAKIVVELAKHAHYIDAAVLFHPSFVTLDDIKEIKVPISILGAETDHSTPPELIKQFDEALKAKSEVDSFVKIYPGVAHGWAVRYKNDDEEAVKRAEEAHKVALDWFGKYIS
ncbi:carboxymethylenebutenolidase [Sarracenia purpurea var. burkii]